MKGIFFFLLAANLALAGLIYVRETTPNPDAQLLNLQMNADQIVIVPPRPPRPEQEERPAVASSKTPVICLEWGSFGKEQVGRAAASLESLNFGARQRRLDVSVPLTHWVYIPPLSSKTRMEKKMSELKQLGVTEYFPVLEPGRFLHAISLGVFRDEDGARKYLATLREAGVRSAIVGEREQRITEEAFLIAAPTDPEAVRLLELKAEHPGTDLRTVECPKN